MMITKVMIIACKADFLLFVLFSSIGLFRRYVGPCWQLFEYGSIRDVMIFSLFKHHSFRGFGVYMVPCILLFPYLFFPPLIWFGESFCFELITNFTADYSVFYGTCHSAY